MESFRSLRNRLTWTEVCLWPILVLNGLLLVAYALAILMLGEVVPNAFPGGWDGFETATFGVLAVGAPFGLGAMATFIRWQRQAARNLYVITDEPVEYGTGWATWGWFLPFANLVVPMRFFREQAAKSSGSRTEADLGSLITLWWCLFLGSRLIDRLSGHLADSPDLDTLLLAFGLGIVAAGSSVFAGLYAIVLLRHITERQDATWSELSGSELAPPTAAG